MSHGRFLSVLGLGLLGVGVTLGAGCGHPGGGTVTGTAGNSGPGSGGSSTAGTSGAGTAGTNGGPGTGGQGGDIVISGNGGSTGAAGDSSGTAGTSGAGTAGTSGGGVSGTAGTGSSKMACGSNAPSDPLPYTAGYTQNPSDVSSAMSAATAMSNDDRAQQMSGLPQSGTANYNVFNQESSSSVLGFYFRDGPRGVNLSANSDNKNDYSTAFPVAIARGAAFDDALENEIGLAIGDEMLASMSTSLSGQAPQHNTMLLAPTVNILRHPAWGRAQETYGEDSFLLGRLGSALVDGVQHYAAACAKHYAGNNIEDGRETANAIMTEQTLQEIYARHFGMIVQDGGVSAVMAAYNQVQISDNSMYNTALHSTQNKHMLTDILRGEFGFKGFVLSDWWAAPNGNSVPYPATSTLQPTAVQAVNAGLDMELPWRYNYSTLTAAVSANQLTASQLITSTARILEQKYRFKVDKMPVGLKTPFSIFDSNSSISNNTSVDPAIGSSHVDLAEKAAEESMVLLKNSSNTLPIDTSKYKKILVLGANVTYSVQSTKSQDTCTGASGGNCMLDFTTNIRTGDLGSSRVFSDPAKGTGPYAGLMGAAPSGVTVTRSNNAADAANNDFVVIVAGLTPMDEGEEYTGAGDRTTGGISSTGHAVNLGLDPKANSGVQNGLITTVAAMNKPMVVVLEGGSVIDMPWFSQVPAVVMAWYPGMAGGKALGRLLFGQVSFGGKLPITWDSNVSHWPTFANTSGTTTMDYFLGYRYFDHNGTALTPASGSFPFGYGLSYSQFTYHDLQVPCASVNSDGKVDVQVSVTNTGTATAPETVFLFVSYPGSANANRSGATYKELKGYRRTPPLQPGQTAMIPIHLRVKDLKYWDTASSSWKVESGPVKVYVAPSSDVSTICTNGSGVGCALTDSFTVN
jgi:beta-glucosidase